MALALVCTLETPAQEKPASPPDPPNIIAVDAQKWSEVQARLLHLEAELKRCQEPKARLRRAWYDHPLAVGLLLGIPLIIAVARK